MAEPGQVTEEDDMSQSTATTRTAPTTRTAASTRTASAPPAVGIPRQRQESPLPRTAAPTRRPDLPGRALPDPAAEAGRSAPRATGLHGVLARLLGSRPLSADDRAIAAAARAGHRSARTEPFAAHAHLLRGLQ